MITPILKMENVIAKQTIAGETYYKIVRVSGIDKITHFFKGLRHTGWEAEVRNKLQSTIFLEGVVGSVLMFTVNEDWKGNDATADENGTWIHKSLLYPFICMSGKDGLDFMVRRFDKLIDENVTMETDLKKMALKLASSNGKITDLSNTIEALNHIDEAVPMIVEVIEDVPLLAAKGKEVAFQLKKHIMVPNHVKFTLSTINSVMKYSKIHWAKNGLKGKAAVAEWCYSDRITRLLMKLEWIIKYDRLHFKGVEEFRKYVFSYKSNRQDNASQNRKTGLPVRFVGLTRAGLEKVAELLHEGGITEEFEVKYY